jgi:hypothetical protein
MPQTTVSPQSHEARLKAVLLWLRVAWLAAVGICVTQYFTVELVGNRRSVNWGIIFLAVMLVTVAYLVFNAAARSASISTRSWLSILAALATGLLVILTGLLGLFAAWAYNPIQYALLVLFTGAVWRVAKWL